MASVNVVRMTEAVSAEAAPASDPYAGRSGRQWWLVGVLTLAATLGAMDRQVLSLFTNDIKADLGLTDTQFSFVYGGAFALANILFMAPAGFLADRMRRKTLLGIGVAAWSLMCLACGAAGDFLQLLAVRAGVGGGEAVIQPASVSMLRASLDRERRGRGFSVYAMALMAGGALALVLGGALMKAVVWAGLHLIPGLQSVSHWRVVVMLLGLSGVPVLFLMLTVREPARAAAEGEAGEGGYRAALAYLTRYWTLYAPLLLFGPTVGMVTLSYGAWIAPVLIRDWGLSIPQTGATLGLMMLLLPPVGLLAMGQILDRSIRRHGARGAALAAIPAIILIGVVHAACPLMTQPLFFWGLLGAVTLVGGCCFPIFNTIVSLVAPADLVGRISAIHYILYGVFGATVGPTVVALVSDRLLGGSGHIAQALGLVSGGYALLALIALLFVERRLRREV